MSELIVQHYRGRKEYYNVESHGQGIYFATDTQEIILNGVSYSGEGSESFITLKEQVQENADALVVLNGNGEGSVLQIVNDAINDFATKISDDGTVNTFKELIDYAATHSAEIIELVSEVNEVKKKNNEQDVRIEALEILVGGAEEGAPTLVDIVTQHTEEIVLLQQDVVKMEDAVTLNSTEIANLQNLVGTTSVASQIEEALSWEDVE